MLKNLVRAVLRLADDRRRDDDRRRRSAWDRARGHDRHRPARRMGWKDRLIDAVVRRLVKR